MVSFFHNHPIFSATGRQIRDKSGRFLHISAVMESRHEALAAAPPPFLLSQTSSWSQSAQILHITESHLRHLASLDGGASCRWFSWWPCKRKMRLSKAESRLLQMQNTNTRRLYHPVSGRLLPGFHLILALIRSKFSKIHTKATELRKVNRK